MNTPKRTSKKRTPQDTGLDEERYYTPTLSPDPDEVKDEDNDQGLDHENDANIGGTIDEDHAVNEDSGAVTPGTPGHPGIDEGTD